MIGISGVSRIYGDRPVVDNVSMTIGKGEITTIVGTSGSGKTTLLRMVNRLIEPSAGLITIEGQDTRDIAPHVLRRGIGYVIQGNGLFPHMTVAENIATVPRLLGWKERVISARIDELLDLLGLDPAIYRHRMPHSLSGGQQQRVGVARALASGPPVMLMDEPFGALDPLIREKAREDILTLCRRYDITVLLVTHDMEEALHMGSRVAVMSDGRLLQHASPAALLSLPSDNFVASLLGSRSDRIFRLLSLLRVADCLEPGDASGEPVPGDLSLRDALGISIASGRSELPVISGKALAGKISRGSIEQKMTSVV